MHTKNITANAAINLLTFDKNQSSTASKQTDLCLSNDQFNILKQGYIWVPYVVGQKTDLFLSMNWIELKDQCMLSLNLLESHSKVTPLLWKSTNLLNFKNNRIYYENQILSQLKNILSNLIKVTVTIIADQNFIDQDQSCLKFIKFIDKELGFNYIIRIHDNMSVSNQRDDRQSAKEWLQKSERTSYLLHARLTLENYMVSKFIATKQRTMNEAWFLVSNCTQLTAGTIVAYYKKRWQITPYFKNIKNHKFGMGIQETPISTPDKRDSLFFISAISTVLLTLLGEAGENIGFDRKLKVNTVKTRTHSLLKQGIFYHNFFIRFTIEEQTKLLTAFEQILHQQPNSIKFNMLLTQS